MIFGPNISKNNAAHLLRLRHYVSDLPCLCFGMIALTGLLLTLTPQVSAQTTDRSVLERLQKEQAKSSKQAQALRARQARIKKDVVSLKQNLIEASAKARGYERDAGQLQQQLSSLETQEQAMHKAYFGDQKALINLLSALQRIDRTPPPSLLTHPQNALQAVRTAHLISSLSKDLKIRSDKLAQQLQELTRVQTSLSSKENEYSQNAKEIESRLSSIQSSISKKSSLQKQLHNDQKSKAAKAKALAKKAKNLRDLIRRLENQADDITPRLKPRKSDIIPAPSLKPSTKRRSVPVRMAQNLGRFADARGRLSPPVLGQVIQKFGTKQKSGNRAKGMIFRTQARAQIIAPFDGRVEFSGSFNDDRVIILNVGNGYFIVLTGMEKTHVKAGENVDTGEPLGLMGRQKGAELFMEFRKNKKSINPMPWVRNQIKP